MTALVTPAQMRAAEAQTIHDGTSAADLMRAAGDAIADWLNDHVPQTPGRVRRALALAGPGNNGGDALVALARLVELGWQCAACLIQRAAPGDLPCRRASLDAVGCVSLDQLRHADVILDGVYGIGGRVNLPTVAREAFAAAYEARHRRGTPLVALDVPSGVDAASGAVGDGAFRADVTLCLGLPKIGLVREPATSNVGELYVLPIGIGTSNLHLPDVPQLMTTDMAQDLLPSRPANAHKSTVGSVLVIGGAEHYYGAPRLAGAAAAQIGAGLVTLAAPEQLVPVIAVQTPELTFLALPRDDGDQAAACLAAFMTTQGARYTAAVIGPGLGRAKSTATFLKRIFTPDAESGLRHLADLPLVVDADALNWLAEQPHWPDLLRERRVILTPHPGEMARLCGIDSAAVLTDPIACARAAAERWQQVVVLKAGYAPVAAPDGQVWLAPRATPELATAGSGDVLAGAIGGLLAQGLAQFDAARLGVYLGALAGRHALAAYGVRSVIARDAIAGIAGALRDLSAPRVAL